MPKCLADGKLLVLCKSAAQLAKAIELKVIVKKGVEMFVPGHKTGVKGVIYEVSLKVDLVRDIEGAMVCEAV